MNPGREAALLDDIRAAITAGFRTVVDISRHVQTASTGRGETGYPDHEVVHGLGHLTRVGELDCIATNPPRRWEYQLRTTHTRTLDCICGPVITAPGIHQHHGPEPHVFVAANGDDIAPDGTATEIHQ
ncbi:hypothetical protein ACFWMR_02255 [Amycolatopsis thailandensis]|uniref:hypothetical protein n=1 Tax=Amycolatopsis thailandensis TaxID=589330 RepID=UPI0036484D2F